MIKSYRGMLATDTQERIRLGTPDGKIGYRIKKFQALSYYPSGTSPEVVMKIYSVSQTAVTETIDFGDTSLLAVLFYEGNSNAYYTNQTDIIFDNMTFNQDVYITCFSTDNKVNYYIELEQIKLTETEALVSIVKNLRTEQ